MFVEWKKIYFSFCKSDDWKYFWKWQNWDIIHFPWNPKFIVKSLVKIFWAAKWEQIFDDFMRGMEWLKDVEYPTWRANEPAAFVLYKANKDDNKGKESGNIKKIHDSKKESWEDWKDVVTQDMG